MGALAAYGARIVVEHFAEGRDHRVLVVNGKVVAAAERVPAHVDRRRERTVRELIDDGNRDPAPRRRPHEDPDAAPDGRDDGAPGERRTPSTASPPKASWSLAATANLSTGGTSIDRTDEMHPDNVTACEMAAGVVGLDIAGIDVLTHDISVPFRENGAVIIEVNAGPGIRMHTHPTEGTPRNVAAPIIDMLYPPGDDVDDSRDRGHRHEREDHDDAPDRASVPVSGNVVGFTTTDGIYLGNRLVIEGDMTGPFSANIILSNPTVDVAVLETARGGILRAGLASTSAMSAWC